MLTDRYDVRESIGRTGTSEVFKAYDRARGGYVAVKTVLKSNLRPLEFLRREFEALTYLNHPNIIRVFDYGEDAERIYYSMDYHAPWDCAFRGPGIQLAEVCDFAAQILSALDYIHRRGFIHGDVKPSNIFVKAAAPKPTYILGDFGLFRRIDGDAPHPVSGTMEYIAPEAFQGVTDDPRSDLYSFGILLFRVIANRLPFLPGDNISKVKRKPAYRYLRLRDVVPGIAAELDEYVSALLLHNPAERFNSAYDALRDLAVLAEKGALALPEELWSDPGLAVGRFFEYDKEVQAVLEGAERRGGEVILLEGPAGAGKTTFMREVGKTAQLRGGVFLYADAAAPGGLLASLERILLPAPAGDERAPPSGNEPGAGDDPGAAVATLEAAVFGGRRAPGEREAALAAAMRTRAAGLPLFLLALDNVAADAADLARRIGLLLRRLENGPVTVILGLAGAMEGVGSPLASFLLQGASAPAVIKRVRLAGFRDETVDAYLQTALGVTAVDAVLNRHIKERARGNPGIIRRLLESLAAERIVMRGRRGWTVDYERLKTAPLPDLGRDADARAADLAEAEQQDLAAAASYGYYFPGVLLEVPGGAEKFAARGLIAAVPNGGFAFADAATFAGYEKRARDAYAETSGRRLLAFLDRDMTAGEPAEYALRGKAYALLGRAERAISFYRTAAQEAHTRGYYERALDYYEAALALAPAAAETAALYEGLGDTHAARGDHRAALANYRRAETQAPSSNLAFKTAKEYLGSGDYEKAVAKLRALDADRLGEDERFLRDVFYAWADFSRGDLGGADKSLAAARARLAKASSPAWGAYVSYVQGVVASARGDDDAALKEIEATLGRGRAAGRADLTANALTVAAEIYSRRGELERAADAGRQAVETAARRGNRLTMTLALIRLGRVYYNMGYVRKAQAEFERAQAEAQGMGDEGLLGSIFLSSAANYVRWGEPRRAARCMEYLEGIRAGYPQWGGYIDYYHAEVDGAEGRGGRALAYARAAEQAHRAAGRKADALVALRLTGKVHLQAGNLAAAGDALRACERQSKKVGDAADAVALALHLSEWALARRDLNEAEAYADAALVKAAATGSKYYAAESYLVRAQVKIEAARATADPDDFAHAETDLNKAKALFTELGIVRYRVKIFEMESELFMMKRNDAAGDAKMSRLVRDLEKLSSQNDLEGALRYILTYLKQELRADRGVIFLLDENRNTLLIKGTSGVDEATIADASAISQTIIQQVAGSGKGVFTTAAQEDARFKDSASVQFHGIRSLLCIPLATPGNLQGVVYLDSLEQDGLFEEEDLNFAEVFARNAAYEIERRKRHEGYVVSDMRLPSDAETLQAGIVGSSAVIRELRAGVAAAAKSRVDVLIEGESGTGKELVVRMLHGLGANAGEPFIGVNCAAIPESLLESELFGIEKGTATGVDKRIGLFERAGEGTIFLDEVGAMDFNTQAKLLRVLQEKQFQRLGSRSSVSIPLRARVVSATNTNLEAAVAAGSFRKDLYYRLNVFLITCPPLRDHAEDIPELVECFLARHGGDRKPRPQFAAEALDALKAYAWPGNVRELENLVRAALVTTRNRIIELADLPPHFQAPASGTLAVSDGTLAESLARVEREMILAALREAGGVKARAARKLGISETNLRYKMKKYRVPAVNHDRTA